MSHNDDKDDDEAAAQRRWVVGSDDDGVFGRLWLVDVGVVAARLKETANFAATNQTDNRISLIPSHLTHTQPKRSLHKLRLWMSDKYFFWEEGGCSILKEKLQETRT